MEYGCDKIKVTADVEFSSADVRPRSLRQVAHDYLPGFSHLENGAITTY